MERIHELLLQRGHHLNQMRSHLQSAHDASLEEKRRIRGVLLRFRREEQVRQTDENETVLYISKNYKYTAAWQRYPLGLYRQFLLILRGVLPEIEGREAPPASESADLAVSIVKHLQGFLRRQGENSKADQLESLLLNQASNYVAKWVKQQVCALVNVLVDSARKQFARLCHKLLDMLFRLIRPTETMFWQKEPKGNTASVEPIEASTSVAQKRLPKPSDTSSLLQEFINVFGGQLRRYYRLHSECLSDLDERGISRVTTLEVPQERKTEWLEGKLQCLVQRMSTTCNQHILSAIGSWRARLSVRQRLPLGIKRRFTTKNSNRLKLNSKLLQKRCRSTKTLLLDSQQPKPLASSTNVQRSNRTTVRNSPETAMKPRPYIEKTSQPSQQSPRRIEYKMNKSQMELNIQLKYTLPSTSSRQNFMKSPRMKPSNLPHQTLLSSNRISGLMMRHNLIQLPHYIQALKEIINL